MSESKNSNLAAAKRAKNDEFYTQWADIEKEMNAYLEYDPDVFRDKVILLPCDDPEWSNFTKFFAKHFTDYGIKKLVSTSYAPDGARGKKFVLEPKDMDGDGVVNDDLEWEYLEGDGDFRSDEITALRDEADMVITNPPFSLFRDFIAWVVAGDVKFSMIGSKNAITYKEVFPLIKENKMWIGFTPMGKDFLFDVPAASAESLQSFGKEGSSWKEVDGKIMGSSPSCWFTNIEHGRRHEFLQLRTEERNIKYGSKKIKGVGYKKYDNYDAIEVPEVKSIPSDYTGVMGVPITFLDKYNHDQFEILGSFNAGAHGAEIGAKKTEISYKGKNLNWNGPLVDGKPLYKRILIKFKENNEDSTQGDCADSL